MKRRDNVIGVEGIAKAVSKYLEKAQVVFPFVDHSVKMMSDFAWYKGLNEWHNYTAYNGRKKVECTRKTLNMAKIACEDWASLLMNERNKFTLEQPEAQEFIDKKFKEENFVNNSRLLIELMMALGGGAYIERYDSKDQKAHIDYIHGDLIYPLKWSNGKVIDCGFATLGANATSSEWNVDFITYTLEEDGYVIREVEFDKLGNVISQPINVRAVKDSGNKGYKYEIRTKSFIPLFQIIKPNKVNSNDKTSPYGVSVFANCIDTLKQIDEDYDALFKEINVGKKKMFVKGGLQNFTFKQYDKSNFDEEDEDVGAVKDAIDPNDTQFYVLGEDWENGKPPLYATEWALNAEPIINSLNVNLDIFSNAVGFGVGFYNFNGTVIARTATEIISVNSKLYKTLVKHESIIKNAIDGVIRGLMLLSNIHSGTAFDLEQNVSVDFDDSVMEDSSKKRQDLLQLYNAGLIDKIEFFAQDRFDGDRELAKQFVDEMEQSNTMRDMSMLTFGGGTDI